MISKPLTRSTSRALTEVVEEKVEAGGKEIEEKPRKAPMPTKVIDFASVLQKSLEQSGRKKNAKANRARRKRTLPRKQRSCSHQPVAGPLVYNASEEDRR